MRDALGVAHGKSRAQPGRKLLPCSIALRCPQKASGDSSASPPPPAVERRVLSWLPGGFPLPSSPGCCQGWRQTRRPGRAATVTAAEVWAEEPLPDPPGHTYLPRHPTAATDARTQWSTVDRSLGNTLPSFSENKT